VNRGREPVRVLVVDDQELVRAGFVALLRSDAAIVIAGEAADGAEAVELARGSSPQVVLMDIRMPVMDGIAATREIATSGLTTRVLVLTTYDLDRYVYDALKAGAGGFMLKTSPPDRLAQAVEIVAAGEALLAPTVTQRLIAEHVRRPPPSLGVPEPLGELTPRECEVLVLVARGLSNNEIAALLTVSLATVKTHVNRILAKLDLRSRAQAVVAAYESGLVRPGELIAPGDPAQKP
jgi:DNA-binding NarL/FixJ family response regulator